jgi:hypothetical protein
MSKACRYGRPPHQTALLITCSCRGILSHLTLTGNLTSYERLARHKSKSWLVVRGECVRNVPGRGSSP